MAARADAFVTLPGGVGTMEEFFETLCWGYLGLHHKPIGLIDTGGYYRPLLEFLRGSVEHGLANERVIRTLHVGTEPATVLATVLVAVAQEPGGPGTGTEDPAPGSGRV